MSITSSGTAADPQEGSPSQHTWVSGPGLHRCDGLRSWETHARGSWAGAGSAHNDVTMGVSQPTLDVPLKPNFKKNYYKIQTSMDSKRNLTTRKRTGALEHYGTRG